MLCKKHEKTLGDLHQSLMAKSESVLKEEEATFQKTMEEQRKGLEDIQRKGLEDIQSRREKM